MYDDPDQLKAEEKEMAADRQRHPARRDDKMITGIILVAVGLIFLLTNLIGFRLHNWWALFILIPFVAAVGGALHAWRNTGRLTAEARHGLLASLFPLFVALIFLFGWNWGQVWPGFLILAGVMAIFGRK
jgi:cation transport ATPase